MRILVSGASGFIGRALVPHLQGLGHEVVPLRRGHDGAPSDLRSVDDWTGWPTGTQAVVHLGAFNPARGERGARDDATLMAANASGTKALAERAAREGVARFVYASTCLVHAGGGEPVDETSPLAPQNDYAASKLAGEEAVRLALGATNTTWTILRLPPVYGPGGRGGIATLVKLARSPLPLPFAGQGGRRSVLSHVNAVDALTACLLRADAANEIFLAADDEPMSAGEIVALVRAHENKAARLVPLPARLLRIVARLAGRDAAYGRLFGSFVVDDRRFRRATGWSPQQSTRAGLHALLEAAKGA